ncbi:MAG TPA: DUF1015 domain-containing protein [Oscillospiraceae bacterium]|nr:DUF1015 domain-containing protein [Oscillospiraceae bacterium]
MATIVPICGVRYNTAQVGQMADLVTPPYDVINEQEQQRYYEKNPYNVIRLEYGETRINDSAEDNRYTRAAGFFKQWLQQNILQHEEKPAVFLYEQEFNTKGKSLTRTGLISGVKLEEYEKGIILPHEETLPQAKADRLQLLRHCRANFSPVFSVYDDPAFTVENIAATYKKNKPLVTFSGENDEVHRLWVINDQQALTKMQEFFSNQSIYIADGHHRYETALHFQREMRAQGDERFGFCLMALVNLHDPGLVIFPTHRLVKGLPQLVQDTLLTQLSRSFIVKTIDFPRTQRQSLLAAELTKLAALLPTYNAILLYLGGEKLYQLTLKRDSNNATLVKRYGDYSAAWRSLDVTVLHTLILEELLGIDSAARAQGTQLQYTRDATEALNLVDHGTYQAAFLLNPTPVQEVTAVATAGDKMPQKTTYFYPKLPTGLVINDFSVE